MIKKISQLDQLDFAISGNQQKKYSDLISSELSSQTKDATVFEVSFKNNEDDESHSYYNSYQCNLTDIERYTGLDWIRTIVSRLTSDPFIISTDLQIGVPGSETSDGVDNYYPDQTHKLSVFSKSYVENDVIVHGKTDFHGPTNFFKLINGVAYRAQWGDLGEYYKVDDDYDPGTILQFGGDAEMTIATDSANGIVSTKPGVVLNASEEESKTAIVALCGKVPLKVVGKIRKFDKITLSDIPGIGIAKEENSSKNTIAIALEDSNDESVKKVLCATKLSLD